MDTIAAPAVTIKVDLLPKPVQRPPAITLANSVQILSQEV
jgi:hypothetical protein